MEPGKKTIAIFDDDEDILSICSYILEEIGWKVFAFTDCNDIVDKVDSINPAVILMDNWIPDKGGIVATQKLKASATAEHIPVIYFSANSDIQAIAAQAGAETYLAKPFDIDDLVLAINAALTRQA